LGAALLALLFYQCAAQSRGAPTMTDAELVEAVQRAARDGATAAEVEARVGERALVNTARDGRGPILMRDLATDEESGEKLPHLPDAREVVLWRRPIAARNPRLIGIQWLDAGPRIFFGVLLPP
jgi:hypothetical protein